MTVITGVQVDKTEYSRYHSDLTIITAVINVTTPTLGAAFTVALFRLDGYGSVGMKTVTLSADTAYTVTFNLLKDAFDSKGFYRAVQGDYVIQATDAAENTVDSSMFAISLVPVKEIKDNWAHGVTFYDYEVLKPRFQPRLITGLEVIEVSADQSKGAFQLVYNKMNNTLAWAGGPSTTLIGTEKQEMLLLNQQQSGYIVVRVTPAFLPTESKGETLFIDNARLGDREIIRQVRNATNAIQEKIITKLEPSTVATDPVGYADEVGIPETYYRPKIFNKWMNFKLPYPNLLSIDSLSGYFNVGQVSTVPRQWLVWNERTGIVEMVPATGAAVSWTFYNSIFILSYLYSIASIPSFWHYEITVGLRDLFHERGVVREAIAKKATNELLNSEGSAYKAGFAAQSISRDGISESSTYTASAIYGTYSAHIKQYSDWLDKEVPRMKARFCGIQFISI
jgi:hypothetical protein